MTIENPQRKELAEIFFCQSESMKKRWMIFVLACCLTAGITGSVVYAYLIDQKETVNQIRILENTTHIEEEFEPPDEVKPGQVIKEKALYCK